MKAAGRLSTGISGLDELIEGGFPAGRTILVVGGPGSGKTIFSMQFLLKGATELGEKALYLSLEEKKNDLYREIMRFGWDLAKLEAEGRFVFHDMTESLGQSPPVGVMPKFGRKESEHAMLGIIGSRLQQVHAARIVVDPISSLVLEFPDLVERRQALLRLVNLLASSGATTILTAELRTAGIEREVQMEEYLAHGVIVLDNPKNGARSLFIEKMRETKTDQGPKPYRIDPKGIVVFPKESIS